MEINTTFKNLKKEISIDQMLNDSIRTVQQQIKPPWDEHLVSETYQEIGLSIGQLSDYILAYDDEPPAHASLLTR